jgi:hypothetical protein
VPVELVRALTSIVGPSSVTIVGYSLGSSQPSQDAILLEPLLGTDAVSR